MSITSDHLANERTYLAWLRTAFALISLGFATNRFSQFLIQTRVQHEGHGAHGTLIGSERFGVGMVFFGVVLILFSAVHYFQVKRDIEQGRLVSRSGFVWTVTALALIFGATGTALLLMS